MDGCLNSLLLRAYKPKDVRVANTFQEMILWLNSSGRLLPFKVIKVTPRPGYGGVEYVDQLPLCRRDWAIALLPAAWYAVTGRFLFRNARIYGLRLYYANRPAYLREGVERCLHFEKLSRALPMDAAKPAF